MNTLRRLSSLPIFTLIPVTTARQQCRGFKRYVVPMMREIARRKKQEALISPVKPVPRSELLEWNYNAEIYAFGKRLGENFDSALLKQALTEQSYVLKQKKEQSRVGIKVTDDELPHNHEMAINGEEIMDNYLTRYLRCAIPRLPEEGIQSIKNYLMSDTNMAEVSSSIGTSEIILSKDDFPDQYALANVFKALVYALKEGNGLDRACMFVRDFVITRLAECDVNDYWDIPNPIGALNNICQNENCGVPEPRIAGQEAVNTIEAVYRVGIYLDKKLIGLAAGETVKMAHETAACDVLRRLFGTHEKDFVMPFKIKIDPNENIPPHVGLKNWCEKEVTPCEKRKSVV